MRTVCVLFVACAVAIHAQSPVSPNTAGQSPASGQTSVQNGNNQLNTVNSPVQGNSAQNGNPAQMGNVYNTPVQTYTSQNTNMMPVHIQSGQMVNTHAQTGQMLNNPVQNGYMLNNPVQNGYMQNNAAQNGYMQANPTQTGQINAGLRQLLNPGYDATRIAGGPLNYYRSQMMQHMKQNQGVRTGHKSTQTGLPPHLLPLMLRSDRGTKIAIMNMMANNPAMAKFLPLAATGGLSDSMMRMLVLMGSQGQGQGPNPLMAMAAMGGGEMSQIAPLLLATQTEGNSASATGNTGAAAANPGSQTGPNSFFDIMMMSQMM